MNQMLSFWQLLIMGVFVFSLYNFWFWFMKICVHFLARLRSVEKSKSYHSCEIPTLVLRPSRAVRFLSSSIRHLERGGDRCRTCSCSGLLSSEMATFVSEVNPLWLASFRWGGLVGTLQKVLRHVSVEKIPKREMEWDQKALHEQLTCDVLLGHYYRRCLSDSEMKGFIFLTW